MSQDVGTKDRSAGPDRACGLDPFWQPHLLKLLHRHKDSSN